MRDHQARQGVRLGVMLVGMVASAFLFVPQASAVTISAETDENVFAGGPFSQPAGEIAQFSNPGSPNVTPHNVYANATGPDGGPLFLTPLVVSPGVTKPVKGTQYLTKGSYSFRCTLHGGMNGVLEITSGRPAPRPKVTPTVRSRSLETIRRKRKVELGLRARRKTGPVRVTVKAQGKVVARTKSGSLKAGNTRKVSVRLTGKGRKTIAKGRSVKFQVTAVAEFGTPVSSSRVLRGAR